MNTHQNLESKISVSGKYGPRFGEADSGLRTSSFSLCWGGAPFINRRTNLALGSSCICCSLCPLVTPSPSVSLLLLPLPVFLCLSLWTRMIWVIFVATPRCSLPSWKVCLGHTAIDDKELELTSVHASTEGTQTGFTQCPRTSQERQRILRND